MSAKVSYGRSFVLLIFGVWAEPLDQTASQLSQRRPPKTSHRAAQRPIDGSKIAQPGPALGRLANASPLRT